MQQCTITIHPWVKHLVNGHVVYVYLIDTICVQINLPTDLSKRTILII